MTGTHTYFSTFFTVIPNITSYHHKLSSPAIITSYHHQLSSAIITSYHHQLSSAIIISYHHQLSSQVIITSYHHQLSSFFLHADHPDTVILGKYCESPPTTFKFLRPWPPTVALPPNLQPVGLSNTRQEYLYNEICQFCEDEYKDTTCPRPLSRKLGMACSALMNVNICPKRSSTCSYCKQTGHTKPRKV